MLARKKTSKQGKILPLDWAEGLARLLNETYKSECEKNGRYFDVYGQIFDEELLVIVSYLSDQGEQISPITCFLSSEPHQMATVEKVKETQKNFIDLAGLFFDEIFANEDWDDFEANWQEVSHLNETYFYKISRENINVTLEANKLLGEEFANFDDDEDEDENEN